MHNDSKQEHQIESNEGISDKKRQDKQIDTFGGESDELSAKSSKLEAETERIKAEARKLDAEARTLDREGSYWKKVAAALKFLTVLAAVLAAIYFFMSQFLNDYMEYNRLKINCSELNNEITSKRAVLDGLEKQSKFMSEKHDLILKYNSLNLELEKSKASLYAIQEENTKITNDLQMLSDDKKLAENLRDKYNQLLTESKERTKNLEQKVNELAEIKKSVEESSKKLSLPPVNIYIYPASKSPAEKELVFHMERLLRSHFPNTEPISYYRGGDNKKEVDSIKIFCFTNINCDIAIEIKELFDQHFGEEYNISVSHDIPLDATLNKSIVIRFGYKDEIPPV